MVKHVCALVGTRPARAMARFCCRFTHLGFEVRVAVTLAVGASTWVQLSRGAAAELDLAPDDQVWVTRATVLADQRSPAELAL